MIGQPGYYRVDVTGDRSRIMTREGGRATVTPAGGQAVTVTPSEELVVEGTSSAQLAAYAAPPLDDWDRWNYSRTDRLLDAVSARYVTPGTYGLSDLDPYGTWRVVPSYGTVWVPTGVPAGWTPYSTGSWILDPVYGWTWVDTAPWGWAPYHYGRWCYVDGYWAWAPGPVIARPVYAPALVAFLGDPAGRGRRAGGARELGAARLGRAGHAVVARGGPRAVLARLGRPTRREQRGGDEHHRDERAEHHGVPERDRAPRGRGGGSRRASATGRVTGRRIAQVDGQRLRPMPGAPQIAATPRACAVGDAGHAPPEATVKRLEIEPERCAREARRRGPQRRSPSRRLRGSPLLRARPSVAGRPSVRWRIAGRSRRRRASRRARRRPLRRARRPKA